MESLILVAVVLWGYFSAYVVSLYARAAYVDPEDFPDLIPEASEQSRKVLARMVSDPRSLVQVATVYRSFILIVMSASVLALTGRWGNQWDPALAYPVVLVVTWILYLTFVEYLPRRATRETVNQRLIGFLWLIRCVYPVFAPVVRVYRSALRHGGPESQVTEEEKEEIVERAIETLAEQAGIDEAIVEEDEKEMIGHIFQLDQTLVREVMTPRIDVVAINKSTRFAQIRDLVRKEGYSRYPVFEDSIDKIAGILYVKDVFSDLPQPGEEFIITNYLRHPYFVPEMMIIGDLLREFRSRKLHVAIVVDDYGGVAGLVTLEDILEEIVGEIQDEHDSEVEEFRVQGEGKYLVDPALRLERLEELLDADYQIDENDTVGGLIYDMVGSVPVEGTRLTWHDLTLEVAKVDGQRITSVRITRS